MRELAIGYVKKMHHIIRKEGISSLLAVATLNAFQMISLPFFSPKIKSVTRDNGLEDVVDFAFNGGFQILRPFQIKSEILNLLKELEKNRPNNIVEIGTARGGTLFLFTRIASDNAFVISIDQIGANYMGGYPEWKTNFYKSFAQKNQTIHLIRADSHDRETLKNLKNILSDKEIDFLFIDGDHSYSGVKRDFELYSPLVRNGGIIAFHDIAPPKKGTYGVNEFWKEIKKELEYKEIIENRTQGWAGIGIIFIKKPNGHEQPKLLNS